MFSRSNITELLQSRFPSTSPSLARSLAMRTTKTPGLLCRSHAATAVCRSHASAAACIADAHTAIAPSAASRRQYHHLQQDHVKYSRRFNSTGGDRIRAVNLPMVTKRDRTPPAKRPTSSDSSAPPPLAATRADNGIFQVVVMRVSIHCQGCAGKIRKHIAKMEGVTSFSIDLDSKRVTVMGHVSPAGVLESISKVKKAEFWNSC